MNTVTWRSEQETLRKSINELKETRESILAAIASVEKTNWLSAGGCTKCHGRGWVVTWDTMDAMDGSYAEFGDCPQCTPASRELGVDPTFKGDRYDNWRDNWRSSLRRYTVTDTAAYKTLIGPLDTMLMKLHLDFAELTVKMTPVVGSLVVVARGRLSLNTIGRIAYINDGGKALIKDPDQWKNRKADGLWAYVKNCDVIKDV